MPIIHRALCKEVFTNIGQYLNTWGEKKNDVLESSQGSQTYLIPTVNLVNFFMSVFEPKQASQNICSWKKSR